MFRSGLECTYSVAKWIEVGITGWKRDQFLCDNIYVHRRIQSQYRSQKNAWLFRRNFENDFSGKAVVTRGLDKCLFIYPLKTWEELSSKLGSLPMGESGTRSFVRLMLAGAVDVDIDKLGRVLIPDYLKEYAGLKKEVVSPVSTIVSKSGTAASGASTRKKRKKIQMRSRNSWGSWEFIDSAVNIRNSILEFGSIDDHKSVLLEEVIENLNLKPGMTVVDGTLGAGGHSVAILEKNIAGRKIDFD